MKISQEYSGNFLKAADLPQPRVLTIQSVTKESVGENEQKLVARFAGEPQGLVLNKTNAMTIAGWYGDDTAGWPGRQVELYATQTNFGGRMVPCIRVRQPAAVEQATSQPAPQPTQQPVPQSSPQQVAEQPQPPFQAPPVDV